MRSLLSSSAILLLFGGASEAIVVYDEGADGDLSGVFAVPDAITLSSVSNTIVGQCGENGNTGATDGSDADYFTIEVPAGSVVSSLTIDSKSTTPPDSGGLTYLGYTAGTLFTGQGNENIDGFVLFNDPGNVLPELAGENLGEGSYSFWLQETSDGVIVDYQITLTLSEVVYDEESDGDLSGDLGSPTFISLSNGANTIMGTVGENGNTGATDDTDADYFTVTIPADSSLSAFNIDTHSGGGGKSFIGYTAGNLFTGQGGGDIAGNALFSSSSGNILEALVTEGSLGAGNYSFWIQETSSVNITYQLTMLLTDATASPTEAPTVGPTVSPPIPPDDDTCPALPCC